MRKFPNYIPDFQDFASHAPWDHLSLRNTGMTYHATLACQDDPMCTWDRIRNFQKTNKSYFKKNT